MIGYFLAMFQGVVRGDGGLGRMSIEKINGTKQYFTFEYGRRRYEVSVTDRGPIENAAEVDSGELEEASQFATDDRRVLQFRRLRASDRPRSE